MRSENPVLSNRMLERMAAHSTAERMTVNGTFHKTALLLALLCVPAFYVWHLFYSSHNVQAIVPLFFGGMIGGLVLCLILCFKMHWAPFLSIPYALCEGLVLGGLSAIIERKHPGIAMQAVGLTMGIFVTMLVVYRARLLQATPAFVKGVVICTTGVCLLYAVSMLMSAFGAGPVPYIHESGLVGIAFSLFVVGLAAFNFILDFNLIETSAEQGAPKWMEWYGAFALLVTLIWLYVEVIRLLAKLRSR